MGVMREKKSSRSTGPVSRSMSPRQERLYLRIAIVLVSACLLWLLFAPGSGFFSFLGKRSELQKIEEQTIQTVENNQRLEEDMDKLLNDPEYLEEIARKDHNLLKKNEKVYDFSREKKTKD
jgi:cell division protein FtsB